jgi:hypothetical protein
MAILGSLLRAARQDDSGASSRGLAADSAFPAQRPLVVSTSRRDVAILPRQSGKTTAAVLRALHVARQPSSRLVTYITKTRKNARRLFWRPLLEWAAKLEYDVELANHSALTLAVPHEDGSFCIIELMGAHDLDQVELLRGTQYDLVIVDETQIIRPNVLDEFLGAVIVPGLRARQGALLLMGTPGPVKFGPFFQAWVNPRWTRWKWTAWDNPTTPPGAIEEEIADLGLKPTDARYVTEYLGDWFDGFDDRKVWDYEPERNGPDIELPGDAQSAGGKWRFSWGIDLASSTDNDALVVLGWRTNDPEHRLYEVDSWQAPGSEDYEDLAETLKRKREQWQPSCAVGDQGGHGATKIVNTIRNRLGIPINTVKSTSVETTIRLMNNDLRKGRFRVRRGGALAQDMQMETWEVSRTGKREIGGDYHSDLTAAARYAYTAARAFRSEAEPELPKDPDERRELEIRKQLDVWDRQQKKGKWT